MSESFFKKRRNPYDERFWRNLIAQSVGKDEGAINEWKIDRWLEDYSGEAECICGKERLVEVNVFRNTQNGNLITVGSCCVRRWELPGLKWRSNSDYLQSALVVARNDREREFIRGLLARAVKYPRGIIVSEKEKRWLEDITGHPWKGRVWAAKEDWKAKVRNANYEDED